VEEIIYAKNALRPEFCYFLFYGKYPLKKAQGGGNKNKIKMSKNEHWEKNKNKIDFLSFFFF
jgi:hypothetical protein